MSKSGPPLDDIRFVFDVPRPPNVSEIRLSPCELVLLWILPARIFDLYETPRSAHQRFRRKDT